MVLPSPMFCKFNRNLTMMANNFISGPLINVACTYGLLWYMALRSIFLNCMAQALIYHSRANVFLKSCFRISRDILLSKNIFGMTIIYNTRRCLEVAKSLPYDIVIQKLLLIKMTTTTDNTK